MPLYKCILCDYESKQKNDYNRHLKTKKHLKNKKIYDLDIEKNLKETQKRPERDPKETQKRPERDPKETRKRPDRDQVANFECQYCGTIFKNRTHLYRHINQRCKILKNEKDEKVRLQLIIKEKDETHEREKKELRDYIDKLIDKTANTTINIEKQLNQDNSNNNNNSNNGNNTTNNTISLNNYGQEDISHITDQMKLNYIKLPFTGVQKMIEQVHFNNNKPENKNIAITNKKETGMIKIYKDNKWRYGNRKEIIDELIQINYGRIDDHYEREVKGTLSNVHNNRYMKFQHQFDTQQDELMKMIKKDIEMIILSDNLT